MAPGLNNSALKAQKARHHVRRILIKLLEFSEILHIKHGELLLFGFV